MVNESRLKVNHAVDATAVGKPDDRQDILGFEANSPSVEDNCCEDIVRSIGVHCNVSNDQQTSTAEKRKVKRCKQLIIENTGRVWGTQVA